MTDVERIIHMVAHNSENKVISPYIIVSTNQLNNRKLILTVIFILFSGNSVEIEKQKMLEKRYRPIRHIDLINS